LQINYPIVKHLVEDLSNDIHAVSYPLKYAPYITKHFLCYDIHEHQEISAIDDFIVSGNDNLEMLQYLIAKQVRILDAINLNQITLL
jgi:hypothetical protein